MRLPKELTTVTTLSKTLALLMFTTLPILAFFFGIQYQQTTDQAMSVSASPSLLIPRVVTPSPIQSGNGTTACQIDADCPSNEQCIQAGPIIMNPQTHQILNRKTCWTKGSAIPL